MLQINDGMAWGIVVAMALGITLGVVYLTRRIPWWWLRTLLRVLAAVWCVLPAPVPGQTGFYAPAFTIAFFEAFLQRDGAPERAIEQLVLVTISCIALVLFAAIARWYLQRRQ